MGKPPPCLLGGVGGGPGASGPPGSGSLECRRHRGRDVTLVLWDKPCAQVQKHVPPGPVPGPHIWEASNRDRKHYVTGTGSGPPRAFLVEKPLPLKSKFFSRVSPKQPVASQLGEQRKFGGQPGFAASSATQGTYPKGSLAPLDSARQLRLSTGAPGSQPAERERGVVQGAGARSGVPAGKGPRRRSRRHRGSRKSALL